jgi:hypothetical protein
LKNKAQHIDNKHPSGSGDAAWWLRWAAVMKMALPVAFGGALGVSADQSQFI